MTDSPAAISTAFEAAWNDHDMDSFAQLFHADATFVNRFATYWRGREPIVSGHRAIHETIYSDSRLQMEPPDVDMLSDDIAVLHIWSRLVTGEAHPGGRTQSTP